MLAGEALSKNHYSTIHGAYENGESQAAKIVDFFHKLGEIKKDYKISNKNTQQLFNGQLTTEIQQLECQFSNEVNISS